MYRKQVIFNFKQTMYHNKGKPRNIIIIQPNLDQYPKCNKKHCVNNERKTSKHNQPNFEQSLVLLQQNQTMS